MSAYTKEETQHIVDAYIQNPTEGTVLYLAEHYEKSVKSIVGKLSREGVYQRKSYKTKAGLDPVTKNELSARIAEKLGLSEEEIEGLEKAPKPVLQRICEKL